MLGFLASNASHIVANKIDAGNSPVAAFSNLQTVFLAIGTILVLSYIKTYVEDTRSSLHKIPGPWYAPFTTLHLRYLFGQGTIWKYVEKGHHKWGDLIRLGPRQVWVSGKQELKDILQLTDLPKVAMYAEISRDRHSPGLFGEIRARPHAKLRRFLGPAFTVSSVDNLDGFFMKCTDTLLQNYYRGTQRASESRSQQHFQTDLMRDLHCVALDIMGESAFGRGFGQIDNIFDPSKILTAEDRAWSKIPNAIFNGLANRYRFVFVKRALRQIGINVMFDWPKPMTKAISQLIDRRKAEDVSAKEDFRSDLLQHMLDEGNRPDSGTKMNNQDIIDQMSELMLAGSETTSGTIGCLFLELARNPTIKKKLLDSLDVLGPEDPVLDSKTVREGERFRYLEACIKENLRMHPIASEMGRRTADKEFVVGDHVLPAHTVVSASYRRLHLNEKYWPEPNRFWPERWLGEDENEGAPEPDMDAYFPFSAGKHGCIGRNFAYAEIRTVSANILSRFDVQEVGHKYIDFRQYITMQIHDGAWRTELIPRWVAAAKHAD